VNAWTGDAADSSARTRIPARTNELFMDVLSPDRYCECFLIRVLMAGDSLSGMVFIAGISINWCTARKNSLYHKKKTGRMKGRIVPVQPERLRKDDDAQLKRYRVRGEPNRLGTKPP
jgi:hypothetical protein